MQLPKIQKTKWGQNQSNVQVLEAQKHRYSSERPAEVASDGNFGSKKAMFVFERSRLWISDIVTSDICRAWTTHFASFESWDFLCAFSSCKTPWRLKKTWSAGCHTTKLENKKAMPQDQLWRHFSPALNPEASCSPSWTFELMPIKQNNGKKAWKSDAEWTRTQPL